jgi:hypothetical protein
LLCLIALAVACAPAARVPAQEGAVRLPPGFRLETFASGLGAPRFMAVSPSGDLLVSVPSRGQIVALPDRDGDGRADRAVVYAEGLNRPHGLAFFHGFLYVAETGAVVRFPYRSGDLTGGKSEVVIRDLPSGGGHWTRTLAFGPDGKMYVSVGSSCNVCEERDPRRAAILQFNPDGTGGRIFARGIRNAVGIAFHPQTGELWATDNGRDWLGDDFPPDTILVVKDGAHYGWLGAARGRDHGEGRRPLRLGRPRRDDLSDLPFDPLVMCVRNPPAFAPGPLRGAWGLHPPSRVGTRNRAALLRRRRPVSGRVAPWAGLPLDSHVIRPRRRPIAGRSRNGCPAGRRGPTQRVGVARRLEADPGLATWGRISDTGH